MIAKYSALNEVRFSSLSPQGWLREALTAELDGMPGHLHEIGYPYNTHCWKYEALADGGYAQWWPYEQTAYWIDSVTRTAMLLDEIPLYERLLGQEVTASLRYDAHIGPKDLIASEEECNRWPHAIYFRALYALWSKTGDRRYLKKMRTHYLSDKNSYAGFRDIVNVETMLRLYEQLGDPALLEKALNAIHLHNTNHASEETVENLLGNTFIRDHGVTYNETAKLYAIVYIYTGDRKYLDASIAAYKRIDMLHMLPDGVHSSSETLCGSESWRTHESCDISDHTWSLGYLLEATGDGMYADKIEKAMLNAFFGATAMNFKAIQYLSCVNQVISTRNSTHIKAWTNSPRMAYQPHHYPECCVGNIGRALPNYVLRMYHLTEDGIAASLYGDSVYEDEAYKIVQSGNFPYGMDIVLEAEVKQADIKKLLLRIPGWSNGYELTVNGAALSAPVVNGYISVPISGKNTVVLTLKPSFCAHNSVDGGVYFTYGPYLLTLKIQERVCIDTEEKRQTKDFPAYNIYPNSPWNYAVSGWETPAFTFFPPAEKSMWSYVPFEVTIKARRLKNWDLIRTRNEKQLMQEGAFDLAALAKHDGEGLDARQLECGATLVKEDNVFTPQLPSAAFVEENLGEEEYITLIPYGCTNLRLTVFPKYIQYD